MAVENWRMSGIRATEIAEVMKPWKVLVLEAYAVRYLGSLVLLAVALCCYVCSLSFSTRNSF
jgi:hypothetical protein